MSRHILMVKVVNNVYYVGRVKVAECGFAEWSKIALLGFHKLTYNLESNT